jgi:hypothetical protein
MKRMKFLLMAVVATMLVFSACETDDLDAPTILLLGDLEMDIVLKGPAFTDPGYTATDEQDGDLTNNVIVTGTVDVNKIGSYEIIYSVSDKAGNKTSVKRTVNVIVEQATYVGAWSVNEVITGDNPDPNWNYSAAITASGVNNMRILIANFGGYTTNFIANVDFDKFGNFTIPNQPLTGSGFNGNITGTGSTSDNGNQLIITYDVEYSDGDKDKGVGTWTKSK